MKTIARLVRLGVFWAVSSPGTAGFAEEFGIVAMGGEVMPDGNGIFALGGASFMPPVLSDDGIVLFEVDVDNADNLSSSALMLGVPGSTAIVGRRKDTPSAISEIGDGVFDRFYNYVLADNGVAGFLVKTESNGSAYALLNSGSDPLQYFVHLHNGVSSPDEGQLVVGSGQRMQINKNGDLALHLLLSGTTDSSDDAGIFRAESGGSTLTALAQDGDPMPSGIGTYQTLAAVPAINPTGRVAFLVSVEGGASSLDEAVLRHDGSSLAVMVKSGDLLSGGDVIVDFGTTSEISINAAGEVALPANFQGNNAADVILRVSSPGSFTEIARSDQVIPGTAYDFATFDRHIMMNDQGDIAFTARMVLTAGGGSSAGIFKNTLLIAQNDQLIPAGDGYYHSVDHGPFALNHAGDMVFECNVRAFDNTVLDALFFYSAESGVVEIIREGGAFTGGILESFEFLGTNQNAGVLDTGRNGFNNSGQVAFLFRLTSDTEGIAIWSPEEGSLRTFGPASIRRETANSFLATFPGFPGIPYRIETSPSLSPPNWTGVSAPSFVNVAGFLFQSFPADQTRFIRISQVR